MVTPSRRAPLITALRWLGAGHPCTGGIGNAMQRRSVVTIALSCGMLIAILIISGCGATPTRLTQAGPVPTVPYLAPRSEEHTSELQSRRDLVCRLLLEK